MTRSNSSAVRRAGTVLMLLLIAFIFHTSARARVLSVPANVSWVDTGITVRAGQVITISATGTAITLADSPVSVSGPEGQTITCPDPDYPPLAPYPCLLTGAPYGTLVGRIGYSAAFKVGAQYQSPATVGGRLYLGVNDHLHRPWVEDNQGGYDVQVTVSNPDHPWCASPDIAAVFGCAQVSINPAGLSGDFYVNQIQMAAAQNPGRLVLPLGSQRVQIRNIHSAEQGFGTLFIYQDASTTVYVTENEVRSAAVTTYRKYIRGTLEVTCDIRSHAGENVGCGVSVDGAAQPGTIAAGQKAAYILDPGSHTVVVSLAGDPAQTVLWAPAAVTRTVSVYASSFPARMTAAFMKAGRLTASLDQPGVVGDWYVDGVQVSTQTATLDRWVVPGVYHKLEARNLMVTATPLIRPWKDTATTASVASGQTKAVTVKLQPVLPGGVKVPARPTCRVPTVTAADQVVIRVMWGALSTAQVQQNADHLTFELILDGQNVGDIRPYRQPVQVYNPMATLGCVLDQPLAFVHWDVPVGRLAAGLHTIQSTIFTDAEIFDGVFTYPPGVVISHTNTFTVAP